MMEKAFMQLSLSMRAHDRILRVARTIADLDDSLHIRLPHLAEAIRYRSADMSGKAAMSAVARLPRKMMPDGSAAEPGENGGKANDVGL
jgi:hypothetical protein